MRKLSVLLVPVLALASVCFAQTKEAIATNNVDTSVDGPQFVGGVPQVTWSPNLNTNGIERSYTIWGKFTVGS